MIIESWPYWFKNCAMLTHDFRHGSRDGERRAFYFRHLMKCWLIRPWLEPPKYYQYMISFPFWNPPITLHRVDSISMRNKKLMAFKNTESWTKHICRLIKAIDFLSIFFDGKVHTTAKRRETQHFIYQFDQFTRLASSCVCRFQHSNTPVRLSYATLKLQFYER